MHSFTHRNSIPTMLNADKVASLNCTSNKSTVLHSTLHKTKSQLLETTSRTTIPKIKNTATRSMDGHGHLFGGKILAS